MIFAGAVCPTENRNQKLVFNISVSMFSDTLVYPEHSGCKSFIYFLLFLRVKQQSSILSFLSVFFFSNKQDPGIQQMPVKLVKLQALSCGQPENSSKK